MFPCSSVFSFPGFITAMSKVTLAAFLPEAVMLLLFIHCLLLLPLCVSLCIVSLFYGVVLIVFSSLSIIRLRKRELVALL